MLWYYLASTSVSPSGLAFSLTLSWRGVVTEFASSIPKHSRMVRMYLLCLRQIALESYRCIFKPRNCFAFSRSVILYSFFSTALSSSAASEADGG